MKNLFLLFFVFCSIIVYSQVELIFKDGKAYNKETNSMFSGKYDGARPCGDGKAVGKYSHGVRIKDWIEYDKDNIKRFEGIYKEGLLDGKAVIYYPHGAIQEEGTYKEGRKVGDWIEWNKLNSSNKTVKYETVVDKGAFSNSFSISTWSSYWDS